MADMFIRNNKRDQVFIKSGFRSTSRWFCALLNRSTPCIDEGCILYGYAT